MFFRKKKVSEDIQETAQEENKGLFSRLQSGLSKTAGKLSSGLNTILMGQKIVDEELLEEIKLVKPGFIDKSSIRPEDEIQFET